MKERWKDIPGFENEYQASDFGRIRSLDRLVDTTRGWLRPMRGRILRGSNCGNGRLQVVLTGQQHFKIHRLVLLTFIGPAPPGKQCCHNNGIPDDNRLENLRWDTASANQLERFCHGYKPYNCKRVRRSDGVEFESACEAARQTFDSVSTHSQISACCRGDFESARGYSWSYIE